jgi:hypothetical protein
LALQVDGGARLDDVVVCVGAIHFGDAEQLLGLELAPTLAQTRVRVEGRTACLFCHVQCGVLVGHTGT